MTTDDNARGNDPPGQVMARLAAPTADEPTRLAVVADPHVATRDAGTSKVYHRSLHHFATAIDDARRRSPDAIVSVGDLTKDGEPWNVAAVDEVLEGVTEPFYSIPGNHDVPKHDDDHVSRSIDDFAAAYVPDIQTYPFHVRIGGIDLVGLNSAGTADRLADTHDGEIDAAQLEWLADTLDRIRSPIVLIHHNLPAMHDEYRDYRRIVDPELPMPPITRNPGPLVETLIEGGRPLVLSGHYHIPAAAVTNGIQEIMVPATGSFPQSYLLLESDRRGTTIRFLPVADKSGLLEAHHLRTSYSPAARALTAMASIRLAQFPLVID